MRRESRMFITGAAAWVAACAWPQVCVAQYFWQVSGAHEQREITTFFEIHTTNVEATYHFRSIDPERLGVPYWLAGFLDRSSSMTAGLRRDQLNSYFVNTGTRASRVATDGYAVSGRHVWRESGWFLGGHSERRDMDLYSLTFMEQAFRSEGYGLSVGKYVAEATAVELKFESGTGRVRTLIRPEVCTFGCPLDTRNRSDVVELSVLHVGNLQRMGYAVSASARDRSVSLSYREPAFSPSFTEPTPPLHGSARFIAPVVQEVDDARIYSASGQLFPTTRLGVGVGYSRWRGDGIEDYTYEVSTVWFFRPNLAAQVGWSRARNDLFFPARRHADTASIRLVGRF
jgi:hypothetical protein